VASETCLCIWLILLPWHYHLLYHHFSLWLCITLRPLIFLSPNPSPCILFMLNKNNSENYRPNYKWATVIEMGPNPRCWQGHSTRDTELHLPPLFWQESYCTSEVHSLCPTKQALLYSHFKHLFVGLRVSALYWSQVPRLQQLKTELNNVKSKLDSYNLSDWHKHTRAMNKAGDIQWKLRRELEPEFLTQVQ
jgi:hypothetical protein